MPAIPALDASLTDGTVALRPAAERDIPEILIAYQDDPRLHEQLGEERPPSGAQLGHRCEEAEADRLSGTSVRLTVVRPPRNDCIGQVLAHRFDWTQVRAELAMWLAPQFRGLGLAPRILRLAAQWLLGPVRLERVALIVPQDNLAMIAAARAASFEDEGVLRGFHRRRESRIDCSVFSLVAGDVGAAPG